LKQTPQSPQRKRGGDFKPLGARSVSEDWTSLAYAAGSDAKAIVARRFVVA
jgi:hypothetical protein